ncbi:inner membrane protein YjdF [Ruminiclostridium hungatei]|uniref:Inner membrane protein YjdF n=1 Tax=Ruminiclostridium hungatei TaxID=48256 RepID=A0A1V4SPN4_RUMHU|nr:DUF2238 domain-containing protein [Ruminiclostridium hungatei]OPX45426.1 inner membrane protein YjdF [Ruminiclostridium hungatei]
MSMKLKRRKYSLIYASRQAVPFKKDRPLQLMLMVYIIVFAVLALNPVDFRQWWYLNSISLLVVAAAAAFYKTSRLTNLSYAGIMLFLILHTLGAHYTYALCPVGEWMKGALGFSRNNYDRLVCLAFGFLISAPVMEILYHRFRLRYIEACLISVFIIVAICALNSLAEMLWAAISSSQQLFILSQAQGDIWDSQRDTAMGLLGACFNMGNGIFIKIRKNQKIHMVRVSK